MDVEAVRWMLIGDWAEIENTPHDERPRLRLERWHHRVQELAAAEHRQPLEIETELQESGSSVAAHQRRELQVELARDLATCRALGRDLTPPWHRRLQRLAAVQGITYESLRHTVEDAAASIQVVLTS